MEKFVVGDDAAHVVLAWMHVRTGERVITGQTLRVAGNPLLAACDQPLVRRQPPALDADRERILRELSVAQPSPNHERA